MPTRCVGSVPDKVTVSENMLIFTDPKTIKSVTINGHRWRCLPTTCARNCNENQFYFQNISPIQLVGVNFHIRQSRTRGHHVSCSTLSGFLFSLIVQIDYCTPGSFTGVVENTCRPSSVVKISSILTFGVAIDRGVLAPISVLKLCVFTVVSTNQVGVFTDVLTNITGVITGVSVKTYFISHPT